MKLSRIFCLLPAALLLAQTAADPVQVARKALDLQLAGKYPDLIAMLAPQAKAAFSEAALAKMGAELEKLGAVEKIGDASLQKAGTANVVTIAVKFATQEIVFRFGVNETGQVAQMFHSAPVPWQRPPYSKPDSFHERDVTIGAGQWKLPGTLTLPNGSGPHPAVVLVHDTGPADRDETVGVIKVFKDLAEGLASRGVVVLRYEKRTRQYPTVSKGAQYTPQEETVDDAELAAALLRQQPEVNPNKVFAIGHGLGGYLLPRIAEEDGKLAGLIFLAANARPLEDVIVDQAIDAKITGPQLDTIKSLAAKVKKLDAADQDAPPILGMQVSYLLDLKGYDAPALAKTVGIPLLVLQGERDFQVTMKDFALWKASAQARKDVLMRSYPALNHLFVAGEGKSTEAEYKKPGHVAQDVVDDIAKWVQ